MQDIDLIVEYESFLLDIIGKVNIYFFGDDYTGDESDVPNHQIDENKKYKVEFVSSGKNKDIVQFNKKNSQIVKTIVEEKIIDILIFLVLRHFSYKLNIFKKNYFDKLMDTGKANDEKREMELKKQKFAYMKSEMDRQCGLLLKKLVSFLLNCVKNMNSYNNVSISTFTLIFLIFLSLSR